jgi:hypothetical protein
MKFAKWVFRIAGIIGIITVAPMLFLENYFAPNINHPLFFYGFVCLDLIWQILYLLLSTNPARYRLMMLPSFLAKFSGVIAITWLVLQQRASVNMIPTIIIDFIFSILFLVSYRITPKGE